MKKIIICLSLFLASVASYGRDTNYTTAQECIDDVVSYASKAAGKSQPDLSYWFYSFANDGQMEINYSNATVTIYNGCHFIGSNEASQLLWKKMQEKLNQQINQYNAGQGSLYGDKASLICSFSEVTRRIDINSCK